MKQTVQLLREGWYGNVHLWIDDNDNETARFGEGEMKRPKRKPLSCQGLVNIAESFMNKEYI
eukprot:3678202-Ditylum_brightwellii.AAC.1